uniref:Membrane protein BRI3 n=1 Tax=Panthera leo TaxID=9689 RepID=A0A8C9DAW7_PANLE
MCLTSEIRPPAYHLEARPGDFARTATGPSPPRPRRRPTPTRSQGYLPRRPRVYVSIHRRNVTRYPAHSIVVGGRPSLQSRVWEDFFTFLGIFLGIILFPFGFICCSASRKQRYPKGGASLTLKGTIHRTFLHPDIFS